MPQSRESAIQCDYRKRYLLWNNFMEDFHNIFFNLGNSSCLATWTDWTAWTCFTLFTGRTYWSIVTKLTWGTN